MEVGGELHASAAFPRGKSRLYQIVGWWVDVWRERNDKIVEK